MSDLGTLRDDLLKFGLSGKQAEIYLLLVTHGELRIQEVVKLTHIPRSSVYQSLRRLFELGLAEEILEGNFKKLRPYPVSVLRHGLDDEINALQQRAEALDSLEVDIAVVTRKPDPTSVRYYKGRAGARQLHWNTLKAANTVYVYTEWGRQKFVGLKFYESFVEQTRERNVKEKVLINLTPAILESIKKENLLGLPTARTNVKDIRVLSPKAVHINGDTFIYNDIYAQLYVRNVQINGFEIESYDFVKTQRSIFETLWDAAKPVTEFL